MRRITFLIATILFLASLPSLGLAQEVTQYDPHWLESPRNFSAGFNVGMIFLSDSTLQDIYGTKGTAIYTLQAGWRLVHELELNVQGSYTFFKGSGITPEGDKTHEKFKLHIAPAELGLIYRFAYMYDQPVVPYLGAHGLMAYWIEEQLDSAHKNRGLRYGVSGEGGLLFLLNKIDKKASGRLESEWGINYTYFFYQYKYSSLNDFGKNPDTTLDLTNQVHTLGILFEF